MQTATAENNRGRAALQGPRQTREDKGALAPVVVYPEHGTGRAAQLRTCRHCGGKPLIVRKCGRNRSCAVCQKCGYHHRTKLT